MTLQILDVEQRSPEWFAARCGIVTASAVGSLITVSTLGAIDYGCGDCNAQVGFPCLAKRGGAPMKTFHAARHNLAAANRDNAPPVIEVADNDTSRGLTASLVAERVAGFTEDTPMSRDMYRGVWSEPLARDLYSGHYQQAVECGFMRRDEDGWSLGYSPDGLVGFDGLIEIKAPRSKTQLLTVIAGEVPAPHMAQCQAGLLVSGRTWLDFVSYVGGMHVYVKRVHPDPAWFTAIEAACRAFETKAVEMVADYHKRVIGLPVAPRIDFDLEVI